MPFLRRLKAPTLGLCLLALACGCSQARYKRWADKQVFGILKEKGKVLPEGDAEVLQNITPPAPPTLSELESRVVKAEFLGDRAFVEKDAKVLTLASALDYALHRNRTYLSRKERVYLSALGLTQERQRFGTVADGQVNANRTRSSLDTNSNSSAVNEIVRSSTFAATGAVTVSRLFRTGARVAVGLTERFTHWFGGGGPAPWRPGVALSATQPLLANAGVLAAAEPLRQAERDVLYEVREFAQYRKAFVVDVFRQAMRLMLQREQARNRYIAYQSSLGALERERALAAANLRSQSQLKQIEQGSLVYHRSWLSAVRSYEDSLDDLKITLGLPVSERIMMNPEELKRLEVVDGAAEIEELIRLALASRTDIHNVADRLADAGRRVKIAHQATLPGLDVTGEYLLTGRDGKPAAWPSNPDRRGSVGLELDLNLNQLPERNRLRAAQIQEQAAARLWELEQEELRSTLRSDHRGLKLAKQQHDLAMMGLDLAQGRLEIEEALMAEGQGTARDIVESQDRMIVARDLMISTMIDHNIARLQMWLDAGALVLGKDPDWLSVLNQEKP